jgi:large subunit ribosomal protein L5
MSAKQDGEGMALSEGMGAQEAKAPGEDTVVGKLAGYDDEEERPFDLGEGEQIENPMQKPILSKVVVNIGVGEAGEKVSRAANLLESLTGQKAVRTAARKTNRDLGVRKSELIGCKVTLRKEKAEEFLKKALDAVDGTLQSRWFDREGNFAFGIEEHINIPGVQYDPQIGIYGMDVCVTVEKPGYRIKRRKIRKRRIPRHHRVDRLESMRFIRDKFGVRVV